MSTPETGEIQRTADNGHLTERIWPVGVHIPVWLDNDCPSCGSAPCGPHPDTLACKECEDEWPCNIAANVAEELDRMAEFIGGNPGSVLRWRASALRGVIPSLAPAPSSEDTPPRVWQEGDDEPDDSVRALAQAEGARLPFLVRASRGGWFFTTVATSTTDGLGLPWSKALKAANTPLVEVPTPGGAT